MEGFNPKDVLVVPNPKGDWSLEKPGRMGWPESKESQTPATKAAAEKNAPQPATSAKEPATNFVPARPAIQ